MGKVHNGITDDVRRFIEAQHVFFVATAPSDPTARINLSPRGLRATLAVLDRRTVSFLDLTGSGVETIAHLRDNGRITLMFCAFDGKPNVARLHGRGRVVLPEDAEWAETAAPFPAHRSARAVVVVDVERVSDSCGFGVPLYEFVGERDLMHKWAEARDDEQIADYQQRKNATSIDGLPAVPVETLRPGRLPSEQV
jgi:predicted pyridoxine 5'-phosphate oxidase superfamily flavin-nucleotide-binding protein